MKKPLLVCLGDLMLDVVVRPDTALVSGSDVPGTLRFRLGGSAGNTARAFVGQGGDASLVCAVGRDRLGRRLTSAMRDAGVAVHAQRVAGATARLAALVAPSGTGVGGGGAAGAGGTGGAAGAPAAAGERTFVTQRGVADELSPDFLKRGWFARAAVLHVPAYSLLREPVASAALLAGRMVHERGGLVSVDLASRAPLVAFGVEAALDAVRAAAPEILFANLDEVGATVGRRGARKLLAVAPVVVVKMGAEGCHVLWRGPGASVLEMDVATRQIAATDTTGAGDAFDAGFLYALVSGEPTAKPGTPPSVAALKRAAVTGHRAAARLLTGRRPELAL